jgi:8-oxo-dGTP diphosphatase
MAHSNEHPRLSVTVDLVLMTMIEGGLAVLLQRRSIPPDIGRWALPGGFVGIAEGLDAAAARILAAKAHMEGAYVEQLYTFGAPGRDPRGRVLTIAYFALLPPDRFVTAIADASDLMLAGLDASGETGLPLAFDHRDIIAHAVRRLRGKLDYSAIAFALLPPLFTLRALQQVHEAILGTPLNKPAFRRRMLDRGWLEPTGTRETGTGFRPAELYRHIPA